MAYISQVVKMPAIWRPTWITYLQLPTDKNLTFHLCLSCQTQTQSQIRRPIRRPSWSFWHCSQPWFSHKKHKHKRSRFHIHCFGGGGGLLLLLLRPKPKKNISAHRSFPHFHPREKRKLNSWRKESLGDPGEVAMSLAASDFSRTDLESPPHVLSLLERRTNCLKLFPSFSYSSFPSFRKRRTKKS